MLNGHLQSFRAVYHGRQICLVGPPNSIDAVINRYRLLPQEGSDVDRGTPT